MPSESTRMMLACRVELGRTECVLDGFPRGASHIMVDGARVERGAPSPRILCIISVSATRLGFSMCQYLGPLQRRDA